MILLWRPWALADREHIMNRIAQDSPAAALALDELIEKKAEQLLKQPLLYRAGGKRGTRELVVHPNYILIYRIRGNAIEVLRIKHAAQQWP